jgi:hypothetical protein
MNLINQSGNIDTYNNTVELIKKNTEEKIQEAITEEVFKLFYGKNQSIFN